MPGIPLIVQIVFLVLKLTGVVAWPWVWVLAPLGISAGVGVVVGLVMLLVFMGAVSRK